MKRHHPVTGEVFVPHLYDDGRYRVADPSLRAVKHHSKNQISVSSLSDLVSYVQRGFHVRMRGVDSGQVNLIRPGEIELPAAPSIPEALPNAGIPRMPVASQALVVPTEAPAVGFLPDHGRIACDRCFNGRDVTWGRTSFEPGDGWSIVNNPMAWGNRTPQTLVLGFSKGGNQNDEILNRSHNDVAFRGGRANLSSILETLGLKEPHEQIDELISDQYGRFSFGSLVRCSVKKWDGEKWLMSGKEIMSSCLRDKDMGAVIRNCIFQFLGVLPSSIRLVIMLGNDLKYVKGCYSAIRDVRPGLRMINAVAYRDEQVVFVHAVHFKAQGATVPDWATGDPGRARKPDTDQPLKRQLARDAVASAKIGD